MQIISIIQVLTMSGLTLKLISMNTHCTATSNLHKMHCHNRKAWFPQHNQISALFVVAKYTLLCEVLEVTPLSNKLYM